ncbi:MAG: glycoside hydrolase family 99-like domain-containing protein [Bacteroidales bacterium]|nr:glycoside hydrolase family 99-like domain-containing protein [Bacteroidales bacterium]
MMKKSILFLFSIALCACSKTAGYDVAAYIWPAYHDDPRYAEIGLFDDHKGEWEAIYNAVPKFEGHRQPRVPEWGYFNEASPEMQEKIIDTALEYGVNTFIFDWYWFDGKPFLEGVLNDGFLKAPNSKKMKFYLMWANHTANSYWDRSEPDKSKVYWNGEVSREVFDGFKSHLVSDYFTLPNYYRIDGKPVFAIYDLTNFINGLGGIGPAREALDALRAECAAAGLPGLHLQAIVWGSLPATISATPGDTTPTQNKTLEALGFDSITNYQWCHLVRTDMEYSEWGEKGISFWEEYGRDFSMPYFPHVSIDWDPNPRYPLESGVQDCVSGSTPEKFEVFLRKAKDYVDAHPDQAPLITVNAWNEWAEGSYLEPDGDFGTGFLEAVRRVFPPVR